MNKEERLVDPQAAQAVELRSLGDRQKVQREIRQECNLSRVNFLLEKKPLKGAFGRCPGLMLQRNEIIRQLRVHREDQESGIPADIPGKN